MNAPRVSAAQIAALLAWARSLSGHHNHLGNHLDTHHDSRPDPGERAAFLAAKHELLARINPQHPRNTSHDTSHNGNHNGDHNTEEGNG